MFDVQQEAVDYDFTEHERSIEIAGRRVNYVDLGNADGPVLLYVHGLMGTWRNWLFNLLPFSANFRVIAVDLPGFGASEMPAEKISITGYADTLVELIAKLGLKHVTLIGNSMGGQVATVFTKRTPELIDKLILVDAAGFSPCSKFLRRISPLAPILEFFLKLGTRVPKLIANNRFLAAFFTKIVLWQPTQMAAELILILLAGVGKPGFVPAIRTITHTPVREVPGEIETPTVVIWGHRDWLIPRKDAYRFTRMIPHARLEMMPEVGHIPMFEAPDRFNALIAHHASTGAGTGAGTAASQAGADAATAAAA